MINHLKHLRIFVLLTILAACSDDNDQVELPTQKVIFLKGDTTYPEGISINPITGELYVTGYGDGSVQKVSNDHSSSYLIEPGTYGNFQNVGIELDISRNRMWVCQIHFSTGLSRIGIFSLEGELEKTIDVPETSFPHFLNDVIVDDDGNAYVTDSFGPQIWKVPVDLSEMSIWVSDERFINSFDFFNLNGLTFTPDNKYIIATSDDIGGEGDLFRIDLSTKEVLAVEVEAESFSGFFFGGDGIVFENNQNLLLFSYFQGITRANFSNDYSSCTVTKADQHSELFADYVADFPTTGKTYNGDLYLVLGQLDHIVPGLDENDYGKLPEPFYLVKTPLTLIQ
ncbi:MAG: hypothetical protein AAGI25_16030 [Bacteroidota bacterium]